MARSKGTINLAKETSPPTKWESELMPWAAEILGDFLYEITITNEFSTEDSPVKLSAFDVPSIIFFRDITSPSGDTNELLRAIFPLTPDDEDPTTYSLEDFQDNMMLDIFPDVVLREFLTDTIGEEASTVWDNIIDELRADNSLSQQIVGSAALAYVCQQFDVDVDVWNFWILRRVIDAWGPSSVCVVMGLVNDDEDSDAPDLLYLTLEHLNGAEGKFMSETVELVMPDDQARWAADRTNINWTVSSFTDLNFLRFLTWANSQDLFLPLLLAPYKKA